jgi:hypothetical protein
MPLEKKPNRKSEKKPHAGGQKNVRRKRVRNPSGRNAIEKRRDASEIEPVIPILDWVREQRIQPLNPQQQSRVSARLQELRHELELLSDVSGVTGSGITSGDTFHVQPYAKVDEYADVFIVKGSHAGVGGRTETPFVVYEHLPKAINRGGV